MNPGSKTYGMEADPPRYPWSKYECFLKSGWWGIPYLRNFNVKLCGNSTNVREEWPNERKDEIYIPLGINAGGIIIHIFDYLVRFHDFHKLFTCTSLRFHDGWLISPRASTWLPMATCSSAYVALSRVMPGNRSAIKLMNNGSSSSTCRQRFKIYW